MGKALELVTAIATQPGTGAAATACSGVSLTIRDSRKPIHMLDLWHTGQAVGSVRLTSPFLHDTTVGMHLACPSGSQILMRGISQPLKTQDTLTITMEGSNGAGDIEHTSFLVYYEDLPGVSAKLISPAELKRRTVDIYAFENNIATGTSGCYSGAEAINVEQDQFRANTEYALLGCSIQVPVHCVRWVAPDWGNLGIGMPLVASEGWHNPFYFKEVSEQYGMSLIPVFNSSNKALITVAAAVAEAGTDAVISTVCARLK